MDPIPHPGPRLASPPSPLKNRYHSAIVSRTAQMVDSKPVENNIHPGRNPVTEPTKEPTKETEDGVPILLAIPPVRQRVKAAPCPIFPMTPRSDIGDSVESPGGSQSSSTSSTFTFNLLTPTTPHHDCGFSFTACPSSPLDDSEVYAFPPGKRQMSGFPGDFRKFSADHCDSPVAFESPLIEGSPKYGFQSASDPSDDRKHFHVRFLQDESPFPKTPDC